MGDDFRELAELIREKVMPRSASSASAPPPRTPWRMSGTQRADTSHTYPT